MTQYPSLTGKQLIVLLKKKGFLSIRQKGSHTFMQHPDGRATVIPVHSGETIGPGLLAKVLKDVEMTKDELIKNR